MSCKWSKSTSGPAGDEHHNLIAAPLNCWPYADNAGQESRLAVHWSSTPQLRVRRLIPLECERLQGFPDHYTRIAWRGKTAANCPDAPRYKALGNAMAVPVMRWIGKRILAADKLMSATVEA